MLIKRIIAQCPKNSKHLCQDFNLTQDQLKKVFLLPHEVAFEPYLKAFQYKVLNSILFTNRKLCKIGYIQDDKCSLCKTDSESLYHIFFECRHTDQAVSKYPWFQSNFTPGGILRVSTAPFSKNCSPIVWMCRSKCLQAAVSSNFVAYYFFWLIFCSSWWIVYGQRFSQGVFLSVNPKTDFRS